MSVVWRVTNRKHIGPHNADVSAGRISRNISSCSGCFNRLNVGLYSCVNRVLAAFATAAVFACIGRAF